MDASTFAFPKPVRLKKKRRPLVRKARPRQKRATPRRRQKQVLDPGYLEFIRQQACELRGPDCSGHIEANHATHGRGLGQKAPDDTAVPLCQRHHQEFHDHRGFFSVLTKEERRMWMEATASRHRARWLSMT